MEGWVDGRMEGWKDCFPDLHVCESIIAFLPQFASHELGGDICGWDGTVKLLDISTQQRNKPPSSRVEFDVVAVVRMPGANHGNPIVLRPLRRERGSEGAREREMHAQWIRWSRCASMNVRG